MRKVSKQEWLETLKSGEYKKGKRFLYQSRSNNFCCLGVLCKLAGYDLEQLNYEYFLPRNVALLNSADYINGKFYTEILNVPIGDTDIEKLSALNDGHPGFAKVIKYIEKNL